MSWTRVSRLGWVGALCVVLMGVVTAVAQEEPALPPGLGGATSTQEEPQQSDEPALPAGLGGAQQQDEPQDKTAQDEQTPALPPGLAGLDADTSSADESAADGGGAWQQLREELNLSGFWEIRGGLRTQFDRHQHQASIGESRVQLEIEKLLADKFVFKLRSDLVYDAVVDRHTPHLERGAGFMDLREASVGFTPLDFMDVRVGRQVLTWGTGDLLFLNDMFPKDWQSFFIGRDVEYLKAPSDALKLSFFSDVVNWDVVFTPRFDPDRFITGERISYYNPIMGQRVGYNLEQEPDIPNTWFEDAEWATRVSRNIGGWELAAYGYWGYWKSPGGMTFPGLKARFPRLNTYGGSIRGALAGGVANFEAAYYDSADNRQGTNRFVNNSEMRFLAGYERQMPELMEDLTFGVQYYVEWMMNYDEYRRVLLPIMPARDELRHVVTFRVTKLLLSQNLELSMFAYYSPSDSDAYLRPQISYKIDDHWSTELGGNVFLGAKPHTFFSQFARDTNVYVALRYSF